MNSKKYLILYIAILLVGLTGLSAQVDQAIGQWKAYLPYTIGRHVTQDPKFVYYAADFSLLAIDKSDNSVRRYSKVEGLSDVGIQWVKHSPYSETLIVLYSNGNLDLVKPDRIVNLPFIKNEEILGNRNIYDVSFAGPARAFISTGFGILELNPESGRFINDVRTGFPVFAVQEFAGFLYAATSEGIYRARNDANINLQDFNTNWELLDTEEGFPADYSSSALAVFDGRLYLNLDSDLFAFANGELSRIFSESDFRLKFLSAGSRHLLAGFDCKSGCWDKIVAIDKAGTQTVLSSDCTISASYAIEDETGNIWLADNDLGFKKIKNLNAWDYERTIYDGPPTANAWDIAIQDNQVWIATGGVTEQYGYQFRADGILSYIDKEWKQYSRENVDGFRGVNKDTGANGDDLYDILAVEVAPAGDRVFAASYIEGLLELNPATGESVLYNEKNSTIGTVTENDPGRTRITDLEFDQAGNLWLTNYLAERPFSVFTKDKTWRGFSTAQCGSFTKLTKIAIDDAGNKWMAIGDASAGLIVFNEGSKLDDATDDRCRLITQNNSNLPSNSVNALAVDLDGDLWVGTEDGVVVFECGGSAFDASICRGSLRIVNVEGDNEYLLKGENVKAIAIDGANRKWFGTTNGIFVQNAQGDERVATFTGSNSPLFDNNIIDIAIDQQTGEVFIATGRGVQSLRIYATAGGLLHASQIEVFPNPVRPEYDGPIAVRGLPRNADVKITDIHGQLIFATKALGGQAVWDGRDYNGRRAATGVYLVFSTSTRNLDSPDAAVAKILILN
jgi:hypothetical protein